MHILFLENEEQASEKNFNAMFLRLKKSPHTRIQLFLSTFKMAKKSRGRSCPWHFKQLPPFCPRERNLFQISDQVASLITFTG